MHRPLFRVGLIAALSAGLIGCGDNAPPRSAGTPQASAPPPIALPATFTGTLPCASCAGIATTLSLFEDGSFRLRNRYEGRQEGPLVRAAFGTWRVLDGGRRLVLDAPGDASKQFGRVGRDTLRLLDNVGGEIVSPLPYLLGRAATVDTIRDRMRLTGAILEDGSSVRFAECETGRTFTVLTEGAFETLGREVRKAQRGRPQPVSASVFGTLRERPASMPGRGELLAVDSVERAWTGGACSAGIR